MRQVILIYPKTGIDINKVSVSLPLSVLFVGTAIKNYEVHIIDLRIEKDWKSKIKEFKNIFAVGISSMTGYQISSGLECAKFVRKINNKIPIIWGGIHPTLDPIKTLKNKFVDYIVIGEGEKTFPELLKTLSRKLDLKGLLGIGFKKDGKIVINKERELINLNEYPIPNYNLLNVQNYITTQTKGERDICMITSRGCPHRCAYCYNPVFNKGKYRYISAKNVIKHIKYLLDNFNISAIHINEDNFFVNKERVKKICKIIIKEKIKVNLRTTCRVDYIKRYSVKFLRLLKRAGFNELYIGVESGSNRVLSLIKKGLTKEQASLICEKLKEANISPKFSFMGGFPTETREEVIETLKLMEKLVSKNNKTYCSSIQLFSPYPGTELFDLAIKYGFNPPNTFEDYGKSNWSEIDYSWLSIEDKKFLEKISYATHFLDGKSVAEYLGNKFLVKILNKIYGSYLRVRIKIDFYWFMPETHLFKRFLTKNNKTQEVDKVLEKAKEIF